jgi:hypothetical protein
MTTDVELLLQRCLLLPSDATARGVLADALEERDAVMARAVRGERGTEYLETVRKVADASRVFPTVNVLWAVVYFLLAYPGEAAASGAVTSQRRRLGGFLSDTHWAAVRRETEKREVPNPIPVPTTPPPRR